MLSIFDLDHTLIKENSSFIFTKHLYQRGVISLTDILHVLYTYFRFKFMNLSIERVHKESFQRILKGKDSRTIKAEVTIFLDKNLDKFLNQQIFNLFKEAKQRGHQTVLLSSSPDFLVESIAGRLGFDKWESSHYAIDNNFIFCDIARLVQGQEKADYASALCNALGISLEQTTAYTDSWHDIPLLERVGKPVAVYPDKKLRKASSLNKWKLIE